jgi:phosphoglycolate phosphatase-like HAD superfamily hydrolase
MGTIIFDFNRTIYDPELEALLPDALETIETLLARKYSLHLVSRNEIGRENILLELNLVKYFKTVTLVETKSAEIFSVIIDAEEAALKDVYVIGDYRHEDVRFWESSWSKGNMAPSWEICQSASRDI